MRHQRAPTNIAHCRAPLGCPVMRDFIGLLAETSALAEAPAGFVWRLIGDGSDATGIRAYENPLIIVNMSVWESVAASTRISSTTRTSATSQSPRSWRRSTRKRPTS